MNPRDHIKAYLDNALTPEERAEMDAAFAQSPELREERAAMDRLAAALGEFRRTPPPTGKEALIAQLGTPAKPKKALPWVQLGWAMSAVVAVAIGLTVFPRMSSAPVAETAAMSGAPEIAPAPMAAAEAAPSEGDAAKRGHDNFTMRSEAAAPDVPATSTMPGTGDPNVAKRFRVTAMNVLISVANLDESVKQTEGLVLRAGGYTTDAQVNSEGEGKGTATITIRVPATRTDELVRDLGDLGTLRRKDSSAQDITGTVMDVDQRLATRRQVERRLLDLLKRAPNSREVRSLTDQLNQVRVEIEQLVAQAQELRKNAAMATIQLTLEANKDQPRAEGTWWKDETDAAWGRFSAVSRFLAAVAMNLLALAPVWLPIAIGIMWWSRRRA